MLYYTTSPYGLIPPLIKRARTLVSYVVITVISVKFIVLILWYLWLLNMWIRSLWLGRGGSRRKIPVSRYPLTSIKWQLATITSGLSLPACHFQLFNSSWSLLAFHFWLFTQTALCSAWNDEPLRFLALAFQGESALLQDCWRIQRWL